MSSSENAPQVQLVIALTKLNSDHLRGENRLAGAEIELEAALAEARATGKTPEREHYIARLRQQFDEAEQSLRATEAERARLQHALNVLFAGGAT